MATGILNTLKSWDRVSIKESKANAYFKDLALNLINHIFADELAEQLSYFINNSDIALDFIEYLLQQNKGLFYAESKKSRHKDFTAILKKSIEEINTTGDISTTMGTTLTFQHPLGKGKYSTVLSVPNISVNGGDYSWKQVKENQIPALMFRVPADDPGAVEYSFAGGISGNPLSNHYKNMLIYWQKGIFMKQYSDVNKKNSNELKLIPKH